MTRSTNNPWLARFAATTAIITLVLIALGGLVTSKGVGMSVPDWPTTYGYNMFLFPVSKWIGGIFYEHTHRLVASGVGLLTLILAVWLWLKESRAWLRWLGIFALFAVILQGVLGGLRVVLYKDEIGIFHAALAQAFLVMLGAIALFTNRWWQELSAKIAPVANQQFLRTALLFTTVLIFAQLVFGATMRHQHAGLAVPDFPLAYGKVWPAMDPAAIDSYNADARRLQITETNPITAFQVGLHMTHRVTAVLILFAVAWCAWAAWRRLGVQHPITRLSLVWLGLILTQVILGAATVLSNKAADMATSHVVVGALSLVTGSLLTIVSFRVLIPARATVPAVATRQVGILSGKPAASTAK